MSRDKTTFESTQEENEEVLGDDFPDSLRGPKLE
jgi:hypothetical protein